MGTGLIVGELAAILGLDDDPFTKGMDRAHATGAKRAEDIGGKMTKNVTLPLLAASGAAVKLGVDFDTSFARMVGLAGVPKAEIDGLKASVLDLAGKTATAPQELADALYDAASAGLTSAQAMDAVTVAAHGAAAGMGTTGDIVGLVASATASYGAANIDAARATDILTATIRAGRADPKELAGSLGRILPVASQLGVSFEEVGGATAFLSNVFGDTNRTVTAMSGLLVKLVSPTQQGRQALEDMGTSAEELQQSIDDRGLMGALELLRSKGFAGNQQALRALFDDIEGYQGALALLNDNSGTLAATMDKVSGSTGALGEAFDAADTDGRTMKQALVDLQVAAIKAGDTIGPFVATVSSGISSLADGFASLPGPAQNVILTMAAVMASVGPLTTIGGKLSSNWSTISSAFSKLHTEASWLAEDFDKMAASQNGIPWGKIGVAGGVAAAGIGLFALAMFKAKQRSDELRQAAKELADEAERTGKSLAQVGLEKLAKTFAESDQVSSAMDALGVSFSDLQGPLQGSKEDFERWAASMHAADEQVGAVGDRGALLVGRVSALRDQLGEAEQVTDRTAAANKALGIEEEGAASGADELTGAVEEQIPVVDQLAAAFDDLLEATLAQFDSNLAYRRSLDSTDEALAKLTELQKAGKTGTEEYSDALMDAEGALISQASAAVKNAQDQATASGATLSAADSARIYKEQLEFMAGTLAPDSPLRARLVAMIAEIESIPENATTAVEVTGVDAAWTAVDQLSRKLASVPGKVRISVSGGGGIQVGAEGGGLVGPNMKPPGPTDTIAAMLAPGEFVVDAETTRRIGADNLQAMMAGGSMATAVPVGGGGGTTYVDQSTFAPHIVTSMEPAEMAAILNRFTIDRWGKSLAEIVNQ